jgi:hypothetical protein
MDFAQTLQETALARWVAESGSVWGYPTILFVHTIGLATVAGLSAAINIRLLGFAPALPLAPLARFYPAMWIGFGLTAVSGVALLIADAVTRLSQPIFYIKLLFVGLAVATMQLLKTRVLGAPAGDERSIAASARILSIASLFFWLAATTAGRLIAYLY